MVEIGVNYATKGGGGRGRTGDGGGDASKDGVKGGGQVTCI